MVTLVIAFIIVILFLVLYMNHYMASKHEERISDSHERRQQHLAETMERIREADRKKLEGEGSADEKEKSTA